MILFGMEWRIASVRCFLFLFWTCERRVLCQTFWWLFYNLLLWMKHFFDVVPRQTWEAEAVVDEFGFFCSYGS
jgi:hypothetical protein